jgi:hypothetical protein
VLNFGHWKDGACATLGEELEQLFSFFSRFGNCTKYMSEASKFSNKINLIMLFSIINITIVLLLTAYFYQLQIDKSFLLKLLFIGINVKNIRWHTLLLRSL